MLSEVSNFPYIVDFLGVFKSPSFDKELHRPAIFIVFSQCPQNLCEFLRNGPDCGGLNVVRAPARTTGMAHKESAGRVTLRMCREMSGAFAHLHSRGVLHRDIKTANVLITKSKNIRICDFGSAKYKAMYSRTRLSGHDRRREGRTLEYTSPELFREDNVVRESSKSDVYSFGVLLCSMVTKDCPFVKKVVRFGVHDPAREISALAFEREVCAGVLKPRLPEELNVDGYRRVVQKCLQMKPRKRPSFRELLRDFSALENSFV